MASKRNFRKRSCSRKIRHKTRKHAKIALTKTRLNPGKECHVYFCSFCNSWHVGHKKRGWI